MPPTFSLTEAAAAFAPWTVEIDGRVHTARDVSRPQLLAFMAEEEAAGADVGKQEAALRRFLRLAFPALWHYVLWPRRDPVNVILGLRPDLREAVLQSFFAAVTPESWRSRTTTARATNGNGSPPRPLADATP